jgi:bacterioferritin-associated ferredoxin
MERPVPIPGWSLPGVMGAGAAQALLKASGIVPEGPVAIVGNGPLIFLIAAQLARAGVPIAAVLLTAPEIGAADTLKDVAGTLRAGRSLLKGLAWLRELRALDVPMVYHVRQPAIEGARRAEAVLYSQGGNTHRVAASLVLLHNGVIPATALSVGAGCKQVWDMGQLCWQPQADEWGATSQERIAVAGDGAGILGATAAWCRGRLAALDAAVRLGKLGAADRDRLARKDRTELARQRRLRDTLDRLFPPAPELLAPSGAEDIVCRCEDVTVAELHDAIAQGSTDLNRVKAFTRCGMGPCQGRVCGPVAAEVIARALGQPPDAPGQFRVRLPVRPVPLAELAALQ